MDATPSQEVTTMDQVWFFWAVFLGTFVLLALLPVWFGLFTKD